MNYPHYKVWTSSTNRFKKEKRRCICVCANESDASIIATTLDQKFIGSDFFYTEEK